MTLLRAVAGLILGLVIFAGLLYSLVLVNFSQRLEDPEVYKTAINETDAYDRIYDEVLVDDALEDQTGDLLGGMEVAAREEVVQILEDVMPPSYLREQTERNIDRFTGYLSGDYEEINFYVDLEEPLERVEPAVLAWVYGVIDDLEVADPGPSGCSQLSMVRLASGTSVPFAQLSDGEMPDSAPSLDILTRECREAHYDEWFDRQLNDPAMNSEAARILEGEKENLRQSFVDGDTREFLKQAAAPLVTPVIDDAIRDIRRDLMRGDRLDLLQQLADNSDDITRDDIDQQAEALRDSMRTANGPGRIVALLMVIVGSILLALVYIPRPADMLRWPGITLLLGSGVCLAVGFVINSAIPGRIKDAIVHSTSYAPDVPTAAINLAGDLAESFAQQATAGFIPAAATVLVIGAVLLTASFLADVLWAVVRRILPGSDGHRRDR